ncbi:hypothetical protein QWY85_15305 [Neolewinella lacunae]|uniref:Transcription elongation factor n=1 Tax=Neolewinella lacunae TaxID=1517758 RepID=A0A923PEV3_9BACT|nr:hypothetical protein [Neolewinella lacunae]MBC6992790.1 hypothetical protein [Neolewinella lacunae]MDN3636034.1 hypothetical protein [Neolewinella lacunae]
MTDASNEITQQKHAIVQHLLAEKEQSYRNMLESQQSDLATAEKEGEDEDSLFDGGKSDQAMNRVNSRASVVEALQMEIDLLNGLDSITANPEVQVGDIVETDRGNFFVAVAADEFSIGGKSYRGISAASPLFQALLGKKAGDKVRVNDTEYTLLRSF